MRLVPHYQRLYPTQYWVVLSEVLYQKTSRRVSSIKISSIPTSHTSSCFPSLALLASAQFLTKAVHFSPRLA